MRVAVLTPCRSRLDVHERTIECLRRFDALGHDAFILENCQLDKCRSVATFRYLETYDAVLWWDSDHITDDVEFCARLLFRDGYQGKIVTGVYPTQGGQEGYTVSPEPQPLPQLPFAVEQCGAGCLLITRKAVTHFSRDMPALIEKGQIYKAIFAPMIVIPPEGGFGRELAEDLSFCFRARQAGVQIVADPRLNLGHIRRNGITVDWTLDPGPVRVTTGQPTG